MDEQNLQDLKPFEQKPYWNPDANIQISGVEFERIFNVLQPFMSLGFIVQSIFDRHLKDGTIKVKYEYTDGSGEVSEEDVKAYTEFFLKMMDEQKNNPQPAPETAEKAKKEKKSNIITDIS